MATRIIAYTAALALALVILSGCASESLEQQAFDACPRVGENKVSGQCFHAQLARLQAQQQIEENNAAILLMGGTAFMNGWNAGRDAPLPMTNYGGRTTIWSGQSGMLQGY